MKKLLGLPAVFVIMAMFTTLPAHAADYFDDSTGLLFQYSDQYGLKNYTDDYNLGKSTAAQFLSYLLVGPDVSTADDGVFDILISDQSLGTVLDQIQLRFISTEQLTNRDILGQTGVEITGSSYQQQQPRRAVIFPINGKTLVVIYSGSDSTEYENFLKSIQKSSGFSDVIGNPFGSEISDVADRGIFAGYKNDQTHRPEFRPDQGINRAEFLKVLVLAAPGVNQAKVDQFFADFKAKGGKGFPDVAFDAWFAPTIFYAKSQGWVSGYPDGSFRPGNLINLAEAAKIILKSRSTFLAEDKAIWFRPFFDYFSGHNILQAVGDQYRFSYVDGNFPAFANCSRAQAAALLSRLIHLDEHPAEKMFIRSVTIEALPFLLQDPGSLTVYDRGGGTIEGSSATYDVYRGGQYLLSISAADATKWSQRELSDRPPMPELRYLGESGALVYLSHCQDGQPCVEDKVRTELEHSFAVKTQDLKAFTDSNFGFSFVYDGVLDFQNVLDQGVESLVINHADKSDFLSINLFTGRADEAGTYDGQKPAAVRHLGNHDWQVFKSVVDDKPRLTFAARFGERDLMVVNFVGLAKVLDVDLNAARMMRSLK